MHTRSLIDKIRGLTFTLRLFCRFPFKFADAKSPLRFTFKFLIICEENLNHYGVN